MLLVAVPIWLGQLGSAFGQTPSSGSQRLSFDHATTGFFLDSAHRLVGCQSCHINGEFRGTPRTCATCHAGPGARAPGKPATHIPTSAACDSCHRPGATSWSEAPTGFVTGGGGHSINALQGVTAANCQTCHNGAFVGANALSKPATHLQTSSACSTCHSTTAWWPATNPHAGVQSGSCATCHNGVKAPGKKIDHIPTTTACDTCHGNFVSFIPARMDHRGLDGQCSTCHSGRFSSQGAQSKPATHVATAGAQCDSCHKSTTSWAMSAFDHANRPAGSKCADCHNGTTAGLGKPANHVPTTASCELCHTNFTSFKPANMDAAHTLSAGSCASCHNGSFVSVNALGRSGRHIPTTISCDSCHTNGFVSWSPARMNHAGLDKQCSSCHSGGYLPQNAQTKTATHISTTAQCDSCHASTTTWATGIFNHSAASPGVAGRCSTCHNGTSALGKSVNHLPTAAQCDNCHKSFTAFSAASMDHAGTSGKCNTCHNGNFALSANAQAKPPGHIPTGTQCDSCHTAGFVSWSPAVMNHAGLSGQCSTCHGGSNIAQNAQTKPPTHVSTTKQCDSCHGNTTSWAVVQYAHETSATGQCDTCHGSTALGKPATHIPTTAQCDSCHNNFAGFKPAAMKHGLAGEPSCATCHGGAYVSQNALAKPATHIQTTATCDSCHGKTYASWATVSFSHTPANIGNKTCSGCHNGVSALGKPSAHIPTSASCDACHATGTAFKPAQMDHTKTSETCATCHGGAYTTQGALAKPAKHIPATGACDTCHKNSNFVSWSPSSMDHTGQTQCSSCHGGAYLAQNAQTKPASHQATSAQCSDCHTSTTTWATAVQDHSKLSPPVTIGDHSCSSGCHNGSANKGLAKPGTHIPTSAQCDSCHTNFAAFAPASMNHTSTVGQCSTCHGGAYTALNAKSKPATHVSTTAQCDTCHASTSAWTTVAYVHDASAYGKCSTCHNGSTALGLPAGHIPTATQQCSNCHKNFVSFKPAQMNHLMAAGQCSTCHNTTYAAKNAQPKSASHIRVTEQCDSCHKSGYIAWSPATMDHTQASVKAQACASCHGGAYLSQNAQTKPATHQSTTAPCSDCHTTTTSWATVTQDHSKLSPPVTMGDHSCNNCHNGTPNKGLAKPSTHIPTSGKCDSCHTHFTAFAPATMDHSGTTGQCANCHGGAYTALNAQAKTATHIPTTQSCDVCHATTAWKPTGYSHQGVTAGSCASCHNGTNARAKLANHIPTTAACDSCHKNYSAFAPAQMNHSGLNGQCATCHSGSYLSVNAQVKPSSHVLTSAQCDTCHSSTTTWATATYAHAASATGTCNTCHGSSALGKPSTHIPTSGQCDSCHGNFVAFRPAVMNHVNTAGQCSWCHGGNYLSVNALAKPVTHIPVSNQCDSCHKSGFVSWSPSVMDHSLASVVAQGCSTCHSGSYVSQNAQTKPVTHQATTAQCSDCHKTTTSWATATQDHSKLSPPVTLGDHSCNSCHNGTPNKGLAKPANHLPTSAACDTCHTNFTAFAPASMNHTGTTGRCATCHGGAYTALNAQAKPATHLPTTQSCDDCHTSVAWKPATYNHSGVVAGSCVTCHNGTTALGKNLGHIPTSAACDTCHKNYLAFAPAQMNHSGLVGQCSSCHSGTYLSVNAQSKPPTHVSTAAQCDTCHTSTTSWATATFVHAAPPGVCSSCHNGSKALGKPSNHIPTSAACDNCHKNQLTFKPAQMDHSGLAGQCTTCHSGGYVAANALAKPTTHIPVTAQCDSCHSKGFAAWSPATMVHTAAMNGQCSTCHGGAYLSQNAQTKPTSHTPTTAQCDTCHKSTVSWATATFVHATPAGVCSSCHGVTALGKPTNHIPTSRACDSCHKNFLAFAPARMDHTGTTGACATCHGGGYLAQDAQAKTATHIPTTLSCDNCHSTTAWKPTSFAHSGVLAGSCATCHNGSNALGKNVTHIPTSAACDTCHKNYTAFAPAQMNHTGLTGQCSTCHNGAYLAVNAQGKTPTHVSTTAQCDSCHRSTTAWAGATFAHAASAVGSCSNCHNGSTAPGKPSTHIPTSSQCDSCHKNYSAFAPATMNHTGTSGKCSTCHGGAYLSQNALAKPVGHIPTSSQCDSCHQNYTAFAPATMNHTGTAGQCLSCHGGGYVSANAQAKPSTNHPVTTASCDSCHLTSAWSPTTFAHTAQQLSGKTCASCHNGSAASGKPAIHIPTSQSCDVCHRTGISWLPLITPYAHTGVAAGSCASCHLASYPEMDYKPANHMSTTASCDACHNQTTWSPVTRFNHQGVATGTCQTCHDGRYPGVVGKPSNHIPTTLTGLPGNECSNCHSSTSSFGSFKMNHGAAAPTGLICKTCHLSGTGFLGSMEKKSLTHESRTTKATDCSASGCHKPLGSKGKLFTGWD